MLGIKSLQGDGSSLVHGLPGESSRPPGRADKGLCA